MRFARASIAECKAFLDSTDYPFEWDEATLAPCQIARIEAADGSAAGYVWFHALKGAPGVVEMHIALHPQYRGRLSRRFGVDLLILARRSKARTLLARPASSEHADLLRRLGFSLHGPFAVLPINPLDESIPAPVRLAVSRGEERITHVQTHREGQRRNPR